MLRNWVDPLKINYNYLSSNPIAIAYNIHKMLRNWIDRTKLVEEYLSANPNAIHLLEQNPDKINWIRLSLNPNAIPLLEQNRDKICWAYLSMNPAIFEEDIYVCK